MAGKPSTSQQNDNVSDGFDYGVYFVTEQIFDSYKDACSWCKQVAVELWFELAIASQKFRRDGRLISYLKCSRGVRDSRKDKDNACKFMVKVMEMEGSKFRVSPSTYGFHNHLLVDKEMGVLTPPMKEMIREMSVGRSKPREILISIKRAFPGSKPSIKQIYNERTKIKNEDAKDYE